MNYSKLYKNLRESVKMVLTHISPKLETKFNYRFVNGEWLDWKNPQDINAKLNILKVNQYYNNPIVTKCIDKYRIREYLKDKNLEKILPKLYGVYDNAEQIKWEELPNQFAIKCNHACGTNIIVSDKSKLDFKAATQQLNKWMKLDYWRTGEVQYRFIEKKIIIEEYLGGGDDLKTYKFFCFNGNPKVLYISVDEDKYINYYDMNFNLLPYKLSEHDNYDKEIQKPDTFNEMVTLAKQLSADFPFVRVDLYDAKGKVYISELTFIPTGGYMKIEPSAALKEWGEWLQMPKD